MLRSFALNEYEKHEPVGRWSLLNITDGC